MSRVGPYELSRELGRGGMGVVHAARDTRSGREVALKLIDPAGRDDRAQERFLVEARALARLDHPNVARFLDAGRVDRHLYLAVELVEGESLARRVARAGPLAPEDAVAIARELAGALEAAHALGIVHRDVKPANVLLDGLGRPRLVDFGLALVEAEERRLTRTGELVGTPAFMAPEQAEGERDQQGPATDVYGLGATLYHLLTGEPPFSGASLMQVVHRVLTDPPSSPDRLRPGLDRELCRIVLTCLAKEPARRFPGPSALAEALRGWERARIQPGRRRVPGLLALGLLVPAMVLAIAARRVGSPGPAWGPLRIDGPAVADLEAWPGLEVYWPLGWVPGPGGLGLRASGRTHPELRLPLLMAGPGRPFRVRALLELDLLEPTTSVGLALEREGQRIGLALRCPGLPLDPATASRAVVAEALGVDAPPASERLERLVPGQPFTLEVAWAPDSSQLTLRALCGERTLLDLVRVGPPPAPGGGAWTLRVGANLDPQEGSPISSLRGRLVRLELEGLEVGPGTGGAGRAARALLSDEAAGRAVARSLLGSDPDSRWLELLLAPEPEQGALVEALWGMPGFDRRWPLELFALPSSLRGTLARVYRARVHPGRDDAWVRRYASHRVWGPRYNASPPDIERPGGAEEHLYRREWEPAHDFLCEAVLAHLTLQGRTSPGVAGMALLHTGHLEEGRELLRQEARDGNKDAYMHSQWGLAAFRLGDWEEAVEAWTDLERRKGGESLPWRPLCEALLPCARELGRAPR